MNTRLRLLSLIAVVAAILGTATWLARSQPPVARVTQFDRDFLRLISKYPWPPGSPMACLLSQLQQGRTVVQAADACEIDMTRVPEGGMLPDGLGAFPTLVPAGFNTPATAACVSPPTRGGFGPPIEGDADEEENPPPMPPPSPDEDLPPLPTQQDVERIRAAWLRAAELLLEQLDRAQTDAVKGALADAYQKTMLKVFEFDAILNKNYNVPYPSYPYNRTVRDAESPCEGVNAFITQCEEQLWASQECRAFLDYISGCANSEVSRTDGEGSCKPVTPGKAETAAILEAECSKLARGADGKNPCDRDPPEGADPQQLVVERCKPAPDELSDGSGPTVGRNACPQADLEKFLSMSLPEKDYSVIMSKFGGPKPPGPRPNP